MMIDTDYQPIFVPSYAYITVLGKTSKINSRQLYMLKIAANSNLPPGVVVNCSYATQKAAGVSGILINNTRRNIWIR